jgi:transposase
MLELKYYDYYRQSKDPYDVRVQLVQSAKRIGIKPTAKRFATSPKTVRKWVERFKEGGKSNLKDQSRRPKSSPNVIRPYWQFKIQEVCRTAEKRNKRINATFIKRKHRIPYSTKTILRVMREVGYIRHKRKKYQRKRDLREIKKRLKPFEKIQIDVKYLDDIPEFYPAWVVFRLPKYQFTARCVRTGALFISYAIEKTVTNAAIFATLLQRHMNAYGVSLEASVIQTDNGTEFTTPSHSLETTIFTEVVSKLMQAEHKLIPPGAKTWQSDVETSHRLIEDELYACEQFVTKWDFYRKAAEYQRYFNLERFNSYKRGSPIQILEELDPTINPEVLVYKPILLDAQLKKVKEDLAQLVA